MLPTVLLAVALCTALSAVVVGCCVSAAEGDRDGWHPTGASAAERESVAARLEDAA